MSVLTGTQVMLLVASETGHVYTFATKKLQPMITSDVGKALIKQCLGFSDDNNQAENSEIEQCFDYNAVQNKNNNDESDSNNVNNGSNCEENMVSQFIFAFGLLI